MLKLLCNGVLLMVIAALCQSAGAQQSITAPPPDDISGTVAATGKAGSGTITTTFAGNATAASSTLYLNYFYWDGAKYVDTGKQSKIPIAAKGPIGPGAVPYTLKSGTTYQVQLQLVRGNPPVVVASGTTNSVVAP